MTTTATSTRSVTLPDGTDLTDPRIQKRVEARVRDEWGTAWVVMWPRYPDVEDGVDPVVPVVNSRPGCYTERLARGVKKTSAADVAVQAEQRGEALVDFDPHRGAATFARLDHRTDTVRHRLAALLKTDPWSVEVACHTVWDDDEQDERLEQVVVVRAQDVSTSPDKRRQIWNDLIPSLGGTGGWEAVDDPVTGRVRLRYGTPRSLRQRVSMAEVLPPALDTSNWSRLALGLDPYGRPACLDLTNGPHTLVVGPTGSGKSVFLRSHAAAALAHGHSLVIIDAIKDGLDFIAFKPWCLAFADDGVETARLVIERVYAEGQRRKALLKAYGAPSWVDLPADIRRREHIQPLTVLFDEFMSAVIAAPVPKGLPKDDPLVEETNRLNADKATILAVVGKIARELRFTGVFLVIAMQRPDAALLAGFGEIRSNLTSAVQLVKPGSLPAQETLRMVFPGDQTQVAAETIMELDDGFSKGLATIGAEGGDVTGFRVAFGTPTEIPEVLEALGAPKPTRVWSLSDGGKEPQEGDIIEPPAQVRTLGTVEFSLDDLEPGSATEPPGTVPDSDDDIWN